MFNKRSTFIQNLNNRRGQVALFVALIFQILFLFFAMIINVGLLVHHKVNLQNSVDLAAYYGAMRQAENMNAIAHINYQIRQSWKLLAWRYRMLGSAGEWTHHPYDKVTRRLRSEPLSDSLETSDSVMRDYLEAPAFCITYVPFSPMPPGENTCRAMATFSGIKLFKEPPVIAPHQAFSASISAATRRMRESAIERCKDFGSFNYLMLGKFVVAFNIDQANRMELIASLSRATSLTKDNFYDLDGQQAKVGIENTFVNNLTSANRSSVIKEKFQVFNSLGADGCNAMGAAEGQPAKWLAPIRIYPGFTYIDTRCESLNIQPVGRELTGYAKDLPQHRQEVPSMNPAIEELAKYIGYRSPLTDNYNFSVGVEKNPWCMAYVGVSAETAPKIPFSPFGQIRLKARAFYKPFGGRMGPWYFSKWAPGAEFSSGGEKIDPLLPPRVTDLASLGTVNDPANKATRAANYSRFAGDKVGLQSYRMLGYFGKAVYELSPQWRSSGGGKDKEDAYYGDSSPNFAHWDHLPFEFAKSDGDIMAWDSQRGGPSEMRKLEMAGILPDAFDIAYYSIEPDFYHNYYLKIREGYLKGPGKTFNKMFRPDLGYHKGYKVGAYNFEEFSVKNQFEILKDEGLNIPYKDQLTYMLTDWKSALTSWAPKNLTDYSLDTSRFGKCQTEPKGSDTNNPTPPTSGNCVVGGSTGYSVKMVSSQYLRSSELFLGGDGGGAGPLRNPPPADDEF